MARVARNLTDVAGGFLPRKRFLIIDRDSEFTVQFKRILKDAGVRPVPSSRVTTATSGRTKGPGTS